MTVKKRKNGQPDFVVAIGGSSGGMEALDSLLENLPSGLENIAWVVAQNGSPMNSNGKPGKQKMTEGPHQIEIRGPQKAEANHIYFPPPKHEILFKDGKLQLSKKQSNTSETSIDRLFISLAGSLKSRAVGIVLSGTGEDGARGIQAIQENGGRTFVQDPLSAKYKGKIRASIKTGKVDFLLSPVKMGAQLKKLTVRDIPSPKSNKRIPDKCEMDFLKTGAMVDAVFQTRDIGIALFDERGRYIKTNTGYNEMLGYQEGELAGKLYSFTTPPGYKNDARKKLAKLFSGEDLTEERLAVRKNGELFSVIRTASIIHYPDGSRFLLITIRDITESIKYRHLLKNMQKGSRLGNWEMDIPSGNIKRAFEIAQILEMPEADLSKLTAEKILMALFAPGERRYIRKVWSQAIHEGVPFDIEQVITTGTKKKKWVRISCTPECQNSKPVKLYGTLRDITKQKETELELERLSLVASKTNNAVFITDETGKTIWINESVEKMTGFSRRELIGRTPGEVLQGIDSDKGSIERISKKLKRHLPVSEVIKNYKKDGTEFWINLDIAPVFKHNKLENFVGIGADITQLFRAREAEKIKDSLEHQQKLFNAIAKNFPDGIIGVLDKKLHYIFAGGSEIEKLGLTLDQFIGNNIFDHISDKSNLYAIPYLSKAQSGFPVAFEAEIKDQTYAVSAVPLSGDDETNALILVVLYNITKRRKAEEDVRKALEQEKELNELKSKFVSIASHEFRTPLSTILSSTFLVSKYSQSNEPEKAKKHIERIESSVRTLTDILNDFLSLGRIEDGKVENHSVLITINEFCETLIDEFRPSLKKGQIIMYHHAGTKNRFFQDPQHLKHVLFNLLSNASKYSSEGQTIWLNTAQGNGQMMFTVKDEGIGIPTIDQPRLFRTFFRANNAVNIQGTGMGLHIVNRYLEIMGGTIHFKSEEKKGSSFTVQFPVSTTSVL